MSDSGESPRAMARLLTWGRRTALAALLIWGAWLLLWQGVPEVCHDEVADTVVLEVCEPMGLTDPRVALYLLVTGLLLFPELSEVELAGVVTLRRRLEEVREEARDLKEEITHIRTQAAALSHANATNRTDVHVNVRQAQTASALNDVDTGDVGALDPGEEAGAYAQMAFEAALAGLPQLLPAWGRNATLVGYTFGDEGLLEPTYQTGHDIDAETMTALTRRTNQQPYGTRILERPRCWAAIAYAMDGGSPVGALTVLVPTEDVPPDEEAGGPGQWEALAAAAEAVAGAYARLLVDLLDEHPVRAATGTEAVEEGQ